MGAGTSKQAAEPYQFRCVRGCTVSRNNRAVRNEDPCIVCTSSPMKEGTVLVAKVHRVPPLMDYLMNTSLIIGISTKEPQPDLDMDSLIYQTGVYQDGKNLSALTDNETLGFMVLQDSVYLFVNGILRQKVKLTVKSPFWGVVKFSGRYNEFDFSLSGYYRNEKFVCSKSTNLKPSNFPVKSGTAVTLHLVKNTRDLPKGINVWVDIPDQPSGWLEVECLQKLKTKIDPVIFDEAMKTGFIICSNIRIVCVGPPGVGKTCLKHLLLEQPLPKERNSTAIMARPTHISVDASTGEEVKWSIIEDEDMVEIVVTGAVSPTPPKDDPESLRIPHAHTMFKRPGRSESTPVMPSIPRVESVDGVDPVTSLPPTLPKAKATRSVSLSQKDRVLKLMSLRGSVEREEKKHIIHFSDSGGQPQFLDLLPIFIRGGTAVMFVANISKDLDCRPEFSYYEEGQSLVSSTTDRKMPQTCWEMIESTARVVLSFSRTITSTPADDSLSSSSMPLLLVVGTHIDNLKEKERKEKIEAIDKELRKKLCSLSGIRLDYKEHKEQVIFPINVLDDKENIAGEIRQRIADSNLGIEVKIPLLWYHYGNTLTKYADECNRQILTLNECLEVGNDMGLIMEDIEQILIFYDSINKYLYHPSYMMKIVITDPQLVFTMLTSLLKISFCETKLHLPPGSVNRLAKHGLFTMRVWEVCLEKHSNHFIPEFQSADLIKLLANLLVLVEVNNGEYFIPSALAMNKDLNVSKFTKHLDCLFLLPDAGVVLQGVFTALIAQLLNTGKFTLPKDVEQYRNAVTLVYEEGGGCILLVDRFSWLELYYSLDNHKEAFNIRIYVSNSIVKLSTVLPYKEIQFWCGFKCSHCSSNEPVHPAEVHMNTVTDRSFNTTCIKHQTESGKASDPFRKLPWLFSIEQSDVPELADYMNEVASKLGDAMWREFGVQLKLKLVTLNNIDSRRKRDKDCYIDVFDEWEKGQCSPQTWGTILDALKNLERNDVHESLVKWLKENGKISTSSGEFHGHNTDTVVRQPRKHEVVMFLLSPADDQWEEIGSLLGVSSERLEELKRSSSSDFIKLCAVIESWVPTPVTWDKLLNKSTRDRNGLALKVLKLFEPDDVRSKSNVSVLSIILIDVLKETPWKDLGTALSIEEDDLKEIHESDPFKCQLAVISLWLKNCRANRIDKEFFIKALESAFYQSKKRKVVIFLLSPADDQWEEIGLLLEVSSQVIEYLKTSFSFNSIKLSIVIKDWVPTPATWEKLLNKSAMDRNGLALKVLKLFQPDDVKKEDTIPVLSVILNDVLKETPWNDLGNALSIEEDDLKKIHEKNSFKRQLAVISLWLQKCGVSKTIKETLTKTLENIKSSESSFKKIDRDYLKKAFKSGRVKARVSKAIIQGPARAGKTSLRCLIIGERYESNVSTGCIETPRVAIHKYGSYDGTCWKFVSDDEMLTEAVRISKFYEDEEMKKIGQEPKFFPLVQDYSIFETPTTSDTSATVATTDITTDTTNSISTSANASDTDTSVPSTSHHQTDSSTSTNDSPKKPVMQPKILLPQNVARDIMQKAKKEMRNILDSVADNPDKTIHKEWLYFIDSGGQIQFQQLLHAFLPCASVLLLVTNLAKGFSDQSSTEMQLDDGAHSVSEYSPTNEVLLEQLIIMVDACSEQQREIIGRDPYLSEIIKPPQELQVMAIATHLDEFEELLKEGKVAETIENKQKKFNQLLGSLKDALICPNLCNSEFFYIIDGRKAMEEGGSRDTVVNKICEELRSQAFEIDIPLRWYAFEILLRKTAESFHGVLTLDVCKAIGKNELQMKNKEVESALKFFHLLNTMLYYPESKAKDLIFAHPRHLFDVVTELAILICKIRNKEGPQGVKARTIEFADTGIVSKEFIAISETSKKILSNISDFGSKLLSLFDYLKIAKTVPAADFGEGRFFMPALLPLIDPSPESQSADCPFVFHFKKSAPIGLFCTFIIYLLSSHKEEEKPHWLIPPISTRISSNYIILRGRRFGMSDVRFLEHRDRYEVYCDKAEHRIALRKHLTEAMKKLVKEREISFEKRPEPALYCPCGQSNVPHTATIETQGAPLLCTVNLKLVECASDNTSDSCWTWLYSTSTAETDKGMGIFSQTLLQRRLNEEPEHSVLVTKLSSIDYQWRELGIALKVEERHLQELSMNMQSNTVKLERVMTLWWNGLKLPYKWVTILDIISGDTIGNQRLRQEIEQFLGTEKVTALSSSHTGPPTQSDDVNPSNGATEKAGDAPAGHDDTGRKIKAHSKQDTEMSNPGAPVQEEDSTHTERLHEQMEKKEPDLEQQKEETEELKKETGEQQKITSREQTYTQVVQEKPAPDDMPGPAQPTMTILEQNKALLKDYTADQIGEYLLVKMGLDQYKETFKEMGINGVTFFDLTYDFLKNPEEFNVKSKFHQKLVMNIVNGVTPVTNYI